MNYQGKDAGGAVYTIEDPEQPSQAPEVPEVGLSLEDLLPGSARAEPTPAAAFSGAAAVSVRTARVLGCAGRRATIAFRGARDPMDAALAPEVDPDIVADAIANGDSVLVECAAGEAPMVVGVVQTRRPREIRLRAATVHIEGDEEVLLRSGRGAVRIREDGDIEVVGSRISAASRGLFRIVGRLLRLN
jgi:hypothetical protein